jgi:hypothetical protein
VDWQERAACHRRISIIGAATSATTRSEEDHWFIRALVLYLSIENCWFLGGAAMSIDLIDTRT